MLFAYSDSGAPRSALNRDSTEIPPTSTRRDPRCFVEGVSVIDVFSFRGQVMSNVIAPCCKRLNVAQRRVVSVLIHTPEPEWNPGGTTRWAV